MRIRDTDDPVKRTHMQDEVIHAGRIRVSRKLLGYLLQLPEEWRVMGMQFSDFNRSLDVYVEGPGLPEVHEGMDVGTLEDITVHVHTLYNPETHERFYRYEVMPNDA